MNAYSIPGLKLRPKIDELETRDIINTIISYKEITWNELIKKCRKRRLVYVRHLICYFLITYKRLSDAQVVKLMAPAISDRTTSLHGRNTILNLIFSDPEVRYDVAQIKKLLQDV